jgi:hypothetical protein
MALRRWSSSARGKIDFVGKGVGFEDYKSIVGFEQWAAIEGKDPPTSAPAGQSKPDSPEANVEIDEPS